MTYLSLKGSRNNKLKLPGSIGLNGAKKKPAKKKRTKKTKRKTVTKRGNKPRNAGMNKGIVPAVALPNKNNGLVRSLNYTDNNSNGIFRIPGNMGRFLGKIEIKPKHSLAVTLDAPQGAGKTRFLFEAINEFAKNGYRCLFVSLEEHPQSNLFKAKVKQYIKPTAVPNISTLGDLPNGYKTLEQLIPDYDVIFIDSWGKIAENERGIDFDRDLRKKFDGKLFFAIFQRTQDNKMRGGSKAQFDGDIILKISKEDDFRNNYVFADKNRYQHNDLSKLHYNIYKNRLNAFDNKEDNLTEERITINI